MITITYPTYDRTNKEVNAEIAFTIDQDSDQNKKKIKLFFISACFSSPSTNEGFFMSQLAAAYKYQHSSPKADNTYFLLFDTDLIFDAIHNQSNSGIDNETEYLIMDSLIFLYEETEVHYYEKEFLKQTLVKKLYDYSNGKEYERYLDLCLNDKNEEWFKCEGIDREEAVREIVFSFENTQKISGVKPDIAANKDKVTHEKITRWFLANYDLEHLQIFEKYINKINGEKTQEKKDDPGSTNRTDNHRFYKCFFSKHSITEFFKYVFPVLFILLFFRGLYSFSQSTKNVMIGYNIGIFCGVLSILIFIIVLVKNLPSGLFNKSSSLLRLIGCILAGYLALNSDESITGIIIINNLHDCYMLIFRWSILFVFCSNVT